MGQPDVFRCVRRFVLTSRVRHPSGRRLADTPMGAVRAVASTRVEKAREKVLVLLEQQGETDPGLSPDVLYADHERAGTLQEELPTPVRVRVSILNRQAQGLGCSLRPCSRKSSRSTR